MGLAAEARSSRRRRGGANSYEENDETRAVFDRDAHERFEPGLALCRAKRVAVARSNPCFEVWLILHHRDFHRPDGLREVQTHLAALDPEYDAKRGKRANCVPLMALVEDAERRAEAQFTAREAEGKSFGPPSTTVFCLTKAIREAAARTCGVSPAEI